MTDRDLIWKTYSEYMASGFISDDTLWAIQDKLKQPISVSDECKLECIKLKEEIQKLKGMKNDIS